MTAKQSDADDTSFLGHPKGLGFLAFTEAWERFSFYGMQALLVLYMVHRLLLPGHIEHVAGFGLLRGLLERTEGALSPQALSSAIFGLYAGLVYLTPLLGGLLADRLLGRDRTVILGALLMAAGHFMMAFEQPFLLALLCLIVGSGCFKGNIAGQVGGLYKTGDHRAADGFQIFYLGINIGAIAAPLVCGTLGEVVGWHWGFAAAGVGMLVGLAIYLSGRKHLGPEGRAPRAAAKVAKPKMTGAERIRVLMLILLLPVMAVAAVGNQQINNAYLVWAERSAQLSVFGHVFPTTWLNSLDTALSVSCLAGSAVFWQLWAKRRPEPDELTKMILGGVIAVLALLTLAAGAAISAQTGQKVPLAWLVAFHLLNSIAFANIAPVGLALFARSGPAALGSTVIGLYYLQLFIANNLVGWLGGQLEKMSGTQFWLLHAALVGAATVALVLIMPLFNRTLKDRPHAKGPKPAPEPAAAG